MLRDEAQLRRALVREALTSTDREAQLVPAAHWMMRPLLREHRRQHLREALRLELDS